MASAGFCVRPRHLFHLFYQCSNFTTSEVLAQSFGIPQELASLLLVVFIYALIWRGVKNLSKIFVKLVPVMSLGYLIFGW